MKVSVSSTTNKVASSSSKKGVSLDFNIGAPLGGLTHNSKNLINNMLPVVRIYPCLGNWASDSGTIFTLVDAWDKYHSFVQDTGFSLPQNKLELSFVPDSLPNESFNNEYGASFLSMMNGAVSDVASDLSQISGGKTLSDNAYKTADALKNSKNSFIHEAGQGLQDFANTFKSAASSLGLSNRTMAMASAILGGQRLDMPSVWKGSGFKPTYSITVRLVNPSPASESMTNKYIVGPLAAILALALPIVGNINNADNGNKNELMPDMYSYPFFCKLDCPGLFYSPAAAIENVSIVRGGESGQINFMQRVGEVTVRIDFVNLHNTMIMGGKDFHFRPTLKSYLRSFTSSRNINFMPFAGDNQTKNVKVTLNSDVVKFTKQDSQSTSRTVPPSKVGDAASLAKAEASIPKKK